MSRFRIESPARFAGSRFNGLSVWQERATSVLHLAFTSGPLVCSGLAARPIVRRGHASEGQRGGVAGSVRGERGGGFAKTGGLADVAAALPRRWRKRGNLVAVVMPFYNAVPPLRCSPSSDTGIVLPVPMGDRTLACRVYRSHLPNSDVPVFLIEHQPFFERDDPSAGPRAVPAVDARRIQGGLSGTTRERFVFFSRAVMESIPHLGFTAGRDPRQRLADRPRPGVPARDLPQHGRATSESGRCSRSTTSPIRDRSGRELMNFTGLPGWLFNPGAARVLRHSTS